VRERRGEEKESRKREKEDAIMTKKYYVYVQYYHYRYKVWTPFAEAFCSFYWEARYNIERELESNSEENIVEKLMFSRCCSIEHSLYWDSTVKKYVFVLCFFKKYMSVFLLWKCGLSIRQRLSIRQNFGLCLIFHIFHFFRAKILEFLCKT